MFHEIQITLSKFVKHLVLLRLMSLMSLALCHLLPGAALVQARTRNRCDGKNMHKNDMLWLQYRIHTTTCALDIS